MITAKMRRTGHSSYSITRDRGAPEVADSGGPPAHGRWAGGASPPLVVFFAQLPVRCRQDCSRYACNNYYERRWFVDTWKVGLKHFCRASA